MDELSPRNSFEVLPFSPSRQMSQRKLSYQEARPETGVPEEKIAPVSGRLTILPPPWDKKQDSSLLDSVSPEQTIPRSPA